MSKAVILLSGGLDSTTCLAVAKAAGHECFTLSFDYGQKHRVELDHSRRVSTTFGAVRHEVIDLSIGRLGGSALTDANIDVPDYTGSDAIAPTYVPARNTVFLSIALGWAEILEADAIYIGVSAIDYSGYPDCRPEFIEAFQNLANKATKCGVEGNPIKIETPLLQLSKADTIKLGLSLGVDYSTTISCYQADSTGAACGRCDSCILRKKGFSDAGVPDPTRYQLP